MLCPKRISKPSRAQRASEAAESEQPGKPAADSPCRPVSTQPRPTPVISQDHHCRSAASPYRTFMAPRSIVQGPKVSGAGHSRHSPKRSDLCRDRETFCWMGGKPPCGAAASHRRQFMIAAVHARRSETLASIGPPGGKGTCGGAAQYLWHFGLADVQPISIRMQGGLLSLSLQQ